MTLSQIIAFYFGGGIYWIRFFGVGIALMDKSKHPPRFSERYGYEKVWRIGKYSIQLLGKIKI